MLSPLRRLLVLEKIAALVPYVHGTSGLFDVLRPAVTGKTLPTDPNMQAVYTAIGNRSAFKRGGVGGFAEEAARRRGGQPHILRGKMDTRKGWRPTLLNDWGRQHIGDVEGAQALVDELDAGVKRARRGEIWQLLQRGTGRWQNVVDPHATLPAHRKARKLEADRWMPVLRPDRRASD